MEKLRFYDEQSTLYTMRSREALLAFLWTSHCHSELGLELIPADCSEADLAENLSIIDGCEWNTFKNVQVSCNWFATFDMYGNDDTFVLLTSKDAGLTSRMRLQFAGNMIGEDAFQRYET